MLIERGATSLVMACNTAHAIYDEVLDIIRRPVINLVNSTIRSIKGLGAMWLGTTVLAHSTSLVRQHDIQLPSDKDQELVQAAIWAAKRGEFPYDGQIRRISSDKLVVAGCTEMPLVLRHAGISRFVNPVNLLL
jgi:aspartate/glutamate racemase